MYEKLNNNHTYLSKATELVSTVLVLICFFQTTNIFQAINIAFL